MKTIRSSRLVKALCFLLTLFFLCVGVFGTVFGFLAVDEGYWNTNRDYYETGVFEPRMRRTASGAVYGYDLIGKALADGDYKDLAEDIRLQKGKTNVSYTLTSPGGKVLFTNFDVKDTPFVYEYEYPVRWYSDGSISIADTVYYNDTREWILPTEEALPETTAVATEPTEAPTEAVPETETASAPEESTTIPAPTEGPTEAVMFPEETAETTEVPAPTAEHSGALVNEDEEVYIEDGRSGGMHNIFMYIYPQGQLNEEIKDFCLNALYRSEIYPTSAQYYGQYEVYHQNDFAVSANGNVYYKLTEEDRTHFDRENETTTERPAPVKEAYYKLTLKLDPNFTAKDKFQILHTLAGLSYGYLEHVFGYTVGALCLALLFGILSLAFAGWVREEDKPVARALHRIPTDILILLEGGALFFWLLGMTEASPFGSGTLIVIFAFLLVVPIVWPFLYMTVVKIKTRTFLSSMVVTRIAKFFWNAGKTAAKSMNVFWKLAVYYVVTLAAGLFFFLITGPDGAVLLSWGVFKLIELAVFILFGAGFHVLQTGAKHISEGDYEEISSPFLFGEFKKHAGYLNSINDGMTKAVEERLKSETTKSELITNVSHDLKTPLTSIVNYVDLLKREEIENEKAKEYIEVIDRQSQRLKKLTFDVVDASKAAAGSVELHPEPLDLCVLLSQVKGEYAEQLQETGLTLAGSTPAAPVWISADGRQLWRVLDNLMSNVVKYSLPGSRVYVDLAQKDGTAAVIFRNISKTELNISPEELTERFVRGDASRNTEGSGLGLYIARSLTEHMGGSFSIGIDGDLFKVALAFPVCGAPEKTE